MENSKIIIGYLIYLPIAIGLTIYVSKMLFKNGKSFMIDIFRGNEEIALATNKLFEIGFYLINIGWALLILKITYYGATNISNQALIEILSKKIGGFSIYLGIMLFLNLLLFLKGRKKANQKPIEISKTDTL
ncbi:hypothetical protein UMM65_14625 [Aureibaculum sp. 2210JD6-5]|uniref:hypothetical protein n=1 Tax=Aureibaculum sp. 2210JD6-5 TaxID=3103957 RepID=UPI002AAEF07D|nr:hypothetical protein [Aureibaculum sp. 2210JD6-5]MDY7396483.1 hypothetical protein [Aureibaculum sp. 2210JD6-5]